MTAYCGAVRLPNLPYISVTERSIDVLFTFVDIWRDHIEELVFNSKLH